MSDEDDDDIDIESDIESDLSDLEDQNAAASSSCAQPIGIPKPLSSTSSSPNSCSAADPSDLPRRHSSPEPVANAQDGPLTGLKGRRKRKQHVKEEKRRTQRKVEQEEQGTDLKGVTIKRAAQSATIPVGEDFATEDLPVNSGGWSGLRQKLDKILPSMAHLFGENCDMERVDWDGKWVLLVFILALSSAHSST